MDLKSGYPFWPVKNGLLHTYPALHKDLTCDVVVIGGGITGALVAYHLAEAGMETVVLDKRHIAWGSTSATTALLQYEIDTPLCDLIEMVGEDHAVRSYLACADAIDKIAALVKKIGNECGFVRKSSLYLASYKSHAPALKREYAARKKHGIRLEWLDQQQIEARWPFRRPAALLSEKGAQVDAYQLAHALLQAGIQTGLQVYDRSEVTKIDHSPRRVHLTTEHGAKITTKKIVFACGYESQKYLKRQVAQLISTYALASEPLDTSSWPDGSLIWESARPYLYLRTTEDGRVIMGGEDEEFTDPTARDKLIPRKTARLQRKFQALFPHLEMEVAFSWAGTFGETKDGLAYIDKSPDLPNAWFALGYGGNGITYSVLAAEIIRDAILDKPNPYADLFRFER
ncbi:MAG: FAD-binding oxidoreductase [Caldilineaceae bacterium]|jgi:glycine/D-amino acid oxidase-like deaminating enzyme|nr:FAD-binding oxidoreductase [Caldilineaceae bacterium]